MRIILIVSLALSSIGAIDPITIDKHPPTTQRVVVENPATTPSRTDANRATEDAWCQFFFNCSVKLKYEVTDRRPVRKGSDMVAVTAQIKRIDVTLTLQDTLFLPKHCTEKLNAHENGQGWHQGQQTARRHQVVVPRGTKFQSSTTATQRVTPQR